MPPCGSWARVNAATGRGADGAAAMAALKVEDKATAKAADKAAERAADKATERATDRAPDKAADSVGDGGGEDRVVSPLADADERAIEGALRPKRLDEFIGQARVREQLTLVLRGAQRRGRVPDHVLLSGPPGIGKTTIAMIIAAELGAPLRITSGPAIERAGDLAAVLSTLAVGEVVFIDEIHRLARPAEEMLYLAMEDFRVDVVVGKGPGATAIPLDIAPFTLVGATTRAGLLPALLRDRFGFTARLNFTNRVNWRSSSGAPPACSACHCETTAAQRSRGAHGARPDRQPAAPPRARLRGGPRRRGGEQADRARRARTVRGSEEGLDRLDQAVLDALLRG